MSMLDKIRNKFKWFIYGLASLLNPKVSSSKLDEWNKNEFMTDYERLERDLEKLLKKDKQ